MRKAAALRALVVGLVLALVQATGAGAVLSMAPVESSPPCPMHDGGQFSGPSGQVSCPSCTLDEMTFAACAAFCAQVPATLAAGVVTPARDRAIYADPIVSLIGDRAITLDPPPPKSQG